MMAANANRALQDSVAQLTSELATLKAGIANAQRNTSTQFGKLTERLDRTEKAQAEPVGKLAKIQESIDRLEQRQQRGRAVAVAAPEVTGSVAPKEESRPQVAEGWRLRDFYDGRAVVESRNGTQFRVGPGSNVPGLGKVETIKREKRQGDRGDGERHHRGVARAAAAQLLLSLVTQAHSQFDDGGADSASKTRVTRWAARCI
jgi:hypothetical protein